MPRGGVLEVGVVLTHACNLACVYCYTGDKKRVRMSEAVADATVDFAFRTAAERGSRLQLGFFGGEPLLERTLLLDLAARARARAQADAIGLTLQVTTNGTLLTPDIVEQLGALQVHVALSTDGTQAQHEAGRLLAGGGSSWEATRAGLRALVAARDRFPFDVIAVIDPCNVAGLSDGVLELVDAGVESLTLNMNWGARSTAPSRLSWMTLLARVFRIDISVCSRCRGPMRVTRAVTTPEQIAAELRGARPPPRPEPPGQLLLFSLA